MRIINVVPKDIEIVFGLSLASVKLLATALNSAEFDLSTNVPSEKACFDSILEFHELLNGLLKEVSGND
jgi:hypothetical protein